MSPRRAATVLCGFGSPLVGVGWTVMITENSPFQDWIGPALIAVGLLIIFLGLFWHGSLLWFRSSNNREMFAGKDLPTRSRWQRFKSWALPRNRIQLLGEDYKPDDGDYD